MDLIFHREPGMDAMKSQQAMLLLLAALLTMGTLTGCQIDRAPKGADPLISPYATRRIWAVAPFANESGSLHADGLKIADQFAAQLENASNIDVLPVNRVLKAMEALKLASISTEAEARGVMNLVGADSLIVGNISAYDPYDPPKLGLAVELFAGANQWQADTFDTRDMTRAATDDGFQLGATARSRAALRGSASGVSAHFDAAAPDVYRLLKRYTANRGGEHQSWQHGGPGSEVMHRYRMSMDLYSEFVTYVMSWRLLRAEADRIDSLTTHSPQASKP